MKTSPQFYLFLFVSLLITLAFTNPRLDHDRAKQGAWVEQVFQNLSEEQRIAQLFLVAAYSNKDEIHYRAMEDFIRQYNIGGLLFFQGTPTDQVRLTNRYQQAASTPLLIAIDAEWGLGMRLQNTISYPRQMTLGALQDDTLIYRMGAEIARQLKLIGVHINFAPVIDVNNNPDNPVIGRRSFGESQEKVAIKGRAYLRGLQDQGIFAVAKHFPGHGDTNRDSHYALPTVAHHRQRLEAVELLPFKKAIQEGVGGIMTAHLYMPAYDATPQRAATLSKKVVTDLLKKQLGFQGLAFTDALNMKGVSEYHQPGEVDLLALQAGHDVLVFPEDVPKAIALIKQAINDKRLDGQEVDEKVKRILRLKYQMNLHEWRPIATQHLDRQLHTPQAQLLKQQLFEKAVTVVANEGHLMPLKDLAQLNIACLSIVSEATTNKIKPASETAIKDEATLQGNAASVFPALLQKYAPMAHHTLIRDTITPETVDTLTHELKQYSVVIVGIHNMNSRRSQHFGLKEEELQLLQSLERNTQVILVPFGSVYSLACFPNFKHIVMPYEDDTVAAQVVPQIIFGTLASEGKLPVSISETWQVGQGIRTEKLARLSYTFTR
ncbi:MAG: glycoside hydrolase family 3 N-terminal domain-containing protein [Bacteroidota bacterium]